MSVIRRAAVVCVAAVSTVVTVFVSHAAAGTSEYSAKPAVHALDSSKTSIDGSTRGYHDSAPVRLNDGLLAYTPSGDAKMPIVYLHGINGRPENGCPWFRNGASDLGWLVCPRGVSHAENGTSSWGGDVFAQGAVVSRALEATHSNTPGVAIGFSQGGYVALDLVKTHQARFRGLVLIAAPEAHPRASALREAGVLRVALASGQLDAAYAPLVDDTQRLVGEGIEARFFDLGRVGHTYAAEDPEVIRDAIVWAAGE
jgi:pimeloyl-ACP methyl ester carboxylesterase